jgi:F-type H+-transporting ATPase subunit b
MEHNFLLAAGDLVEIAKATGEQFGFNRQLFISQIISFCIVAFLLHRFAYKPILKVLEERRRTIAQGVANAEKIRQELASAQVKAQEILNQAGVQGAKMIEDARGAAAKVQEQETQKAIAAANDIVTKARQASEAELARMKAELRREVGRLVVATTTKVTGKVLSPEDQQRLTDETNRQVAA